MLKLYRTKNIVFVFTMFDTSAFSSTHKIYYVDLCTYPSRYMWNVWYWKSILWKLLAKHVVVLFWLKGVSLVGVLAVCHKMWSLCSANVFALVLPLILWGIHILRANVKSCITISKQQEIHFKYRKYDRTVHLTVTFGKLL